MRTTRRGKFVFQLAIIFIICSIANIFFLFSATAATYFVRQEASPGGDGSSWPSAFNNIQVAIAAATASPDQVWIKAGSYSPTDTITVSEAITIYGGFSGTETAVNQRDVTTNPTIINGFADRHAMVLASSSGVTLDGLTFSNSTYSENALNIESSSSSQLTNCSFTGNTNGLGIFYGTVTDCYFSGNKRSIHVYWDGVSDKATTVLIEGCIFENNLNDQAGTTGWGSGIYLDEFTGAEIDSCIFKSNRAGAGSAIAVYSEATALINNCVFGGETFAEGNSSTAVGGGAIFGYIDADIDVANCSFQNNWVETGLDGGAIYSQDGNLAIDNSIFTDNSSPASGGAVAIRRNTGAKNSTITSSRFRTNTAGAQGGAVFSESDLTTIINSNFINNSAAIGGGFAGSGLVENTLFNGNTATTGHGGGSFIATEEIQSDIVHCVFYNNTAGSYGGAVSSAHSFTAYNVIFLDNSAADEDYADIYNDSSYIPVISNSRISQSPYADDNNNISDAPQFVDAVNADFHLLHTSPCVDAGLPESVPELSPTDPDGNSRQMDGDYDGKAEPDMGIYELFPPGDVDSNGYLELADLIRTLQIASGISGLPVELAADVNGDDRIGLEDAIYELDILVKTSDHSINIAGNWVGTLNLENQYIFDNGYKSHKQVTAVIQQDGDVVTIKTNSNLLYGKKFTGHITEKGYITVIDVTTYKIWTTHVAKATNNTIQLYDYVNYFTAFDTLFLTRETQ